ncbi:hypothetical protein SteCoe_28975 [Stentor coeruleus]|uniref:RBR-type E3 ubiquitin transferase n=1 Tax=Stentor coeruleus TaxID=5963 RepID=A0A1R2B708_9CILI|nr:hypothetical protein SteCoe_28975 [Stentor coeruleus]
MRLQSKLKMDSNYLSEPLLSQDDYCPICLISNPTCGLIDCEHFFCKRCLTEYIELKILDGQVNKITCPAINCQTILQSHTIEELVSVSIFNKYTDFYRKKTLEADIYFRWCPEKNCTGYDIFKGNNKLKCQFCSFEYCFLCADPWHSNKNCKPLDSGFIEWEKSSSVKICPTCKVRTERNGGCPYMICHKCTTSWCWICGKADNEHDGLNCLIGPNWYDMHILILLIMIFLPVLLPFTLVIALAAFMYYDGHLINDSSSVVLGYFSRFRILFYVIFTVISPPIVAVVGVIGILYFAFKSAIYCVPENVWEKKDACRVLRGAFVVLLALLFTIIYLLVTVVVVLASCPVGIILLVIKYGYQTIIFMKKRLEKKEI